MSRCPVCGEYILGDGTEDADWREICEACEMQVEEDGENE